MYDRLDVLDWPGHLDKMVVDFRDIQSEWDLVVEQSSNGCAQDCMAYVARQKIEIVCLVVVGTAVEARQEGPLFSVHFCVLLHWLLLPFSPQVFLLLFAFYLPRLSFCFRL